MSRRVYVIELAPAAGRRRDPRIPWVYVGCSAREPEIRFDQHRRGYRSAGIVRRHGLRLRPDLYDDLAPVRGTAAGEAAELARALELASCGFVAHSDGRSHGDGEGAWREWDGPRVDRVRPHLQAAADELRECAFAEPTAAELARLLRGEPGFWVQRFIDQSDPPPAYGRFAHVGIDALEARLNPAAARA